MVNAIKAALKRLSQFATVAAVSFFAWQPAALADPALWVLRDEDSTIYLFGTIHVMKPGVKWHSDKLDAAFASSSELWVEETGDDNQTMMYQLVKTYGVDPHHPITAKLTPAQQARFVKVSQVLGLDPAAVDRTRPWLAAAMLGGAAVARTGFISEKGIDRSLEADAKAAGKPIKSFETPEQQIHVFADLKPEEELAMLTQTLDEVGKGPTYLMLIATSWLHGDIEQLDKQLSANMRGQTPALYKAILPDRNARWVKRIEEMMVGKGTAFIAVGTAHLIGQDSVIAMLAKDGYKAERVQ
ncbi:MAG TPA: TraB/GumN family protein [Dongiaceae bacterium]|nr:TraB/GumN family protein [Dongiaceae bacterium]